MLFDFFLKYYLCGRDRLFAFLNNCPCERSESRAHVHKPRLGACTQAVVQGGGGEGTVKLMWGKQVGLNWGNGPL